VILDLAAYAQDLARARSIPERVDLAASRLLELGFNSMCYDYTPVPLSHEGIVIAPNLVEPRNVPESFTRLWLEDGYAAIDPVQALAVRASLPFVWSVGRAAARPREVLARPTRQWSITCATQG
jgi:LuxR family transcriptional regulator